MAKFMVVFLFERVHAPVELQNGCFFYPDCNSDEIHWFRSEQRLVKDQTSLTSIITWSQRPLVRMTDGTAASSSPLSSLFVAPLSHVFLFRNIDAVLIDLWWFTSFPPCDNFAAQLLKAKFIKRNRHVYELLSSISRWLYFLYRESCFSFQKRFDWLFWTKLLPSLNRRLCFVFYPQNFYNDHACVLLAITIEMLFSLCTFQIFSFGVIVLVCENHCCSASYLFLTLKISWKLTTLPIQTSELDTSSWSIDF